MNKKISSILLVIILAFAAYFLVKGIRTQPPVDQGVYKSDTVAPTTESPVPPAPVQATSGNVHVVSMTDKGYLPMSLTIKKGDTVTFKNDGTEASWPASAIHPTHAGYPTTGGCLGSTFDACKGIAPGASWSFTFDVVGSWGYHDHLNPSHFGKIIVIE